MPRFERSSSKAPGLARDRADNYQKSVVLLKLRAPLVNTIHYQNVGHSTTKPPIHPESLLSDAQNIKFLQFVQLPELFHPEDERYLQNHTGEICHF